MLCRICCVCKNPIDPKDMVYAEMITVEEMTQGENLELARSGKTLCECTVLEVCTACYATQRSLQSQFFGRELFPSLTRGRGRPKRKRSKNKEEKAAPKKRQDRPKKVDRPVVKVKNGEGDIVERKPPSKPTIPE